MEVAEANIGTDVQKSSTVVSEGSHEVIIEKTSDDSVEQEINSIRSLEQSTDKSVQQSTEISQVVQKTVSSSVSENENKNPEENENGSTTSTTTTTTKIIKKVSPVKVIDENKVTIEDVGEDNDGDEYQEIIEEVEKSGTETGSGDSESDVEVTQTVAKTLITKKESKPNDYNEEVTVTIKKIVKSDGERNVEVEEKKKEENEGKALTPPEIRNKNDIKKEEEVKEEEVGKQQVIEEEVIEKVILKSPSTRNESISKQQQIETYVSENATTTTTAMGKISQSAQISEKTPVQSRKQSLIEYQAQVQNIATQSQNAKIEENDLALTKGEQPPSKPMGLPVSQSQKVESALPVLSTQQTQVEKLLSSSQLPQSQLQTQYQPPSQSRSQYQALAQPQPQPQYWSAPQIPYQPQYKPKYQQQHQSTHISQPSLQSVSSLQFQQQLQQNQQIPASEIRQESIKNTLKEIISDIDRVIEQDEGKSHVVMKSSKTETSNSDSGYTSKSELYERTEFKESSSTTGPKSINLQKLFTPATDAEEISPKNRKLYASSAFYSPNLHPTVEDQVELARRISHSLSDISNQQSKGQSMYVNRKKRSVKWVHEGEGKADIQEYNGYSEDTKENGFESKISTSSVHHEKVPLKLVMNPRGQVRDFQSYQDDFNTQTGLLSPDKCAELVTALQAPKGKGAELFAKRRKKAENWIIDETNAATRSPSGVPGYKRTSPITPAYLDAGHHVQLNIQQDQIMQDKYASNQRLKIVKTPWESALGTGSPANAFQEVSSESQQQQRNVYSETTIQHQNEQYFPTSYESEQKSQLYNKPYPRQTSVPTNSHRDLAYKPSVPQGWNAPPPNLPSAYISAMQNNSHYHAQHHHHNDLSISNNCYQSEHLVIENKGKIEKLHQKQYSVATQKQTQNISRETKSKIEDFIGYLKDENFSQSDEDEIIQCMERTKLRRADEESLLLSQENAIKQNYINCIAKSPELMISSARESYQKYDSAVKEFKSSIVKLQHHNEPNLIDSIKSESCNFINNNTNMTSSNGQVSMNLDNQLQSFTITTGVENVHSSANHCEVKVEQKCRIFPEIGNQFEYQKEQREQQMKLQKVSKSNIIDVQDADEIQQVENDEYKKIPVKDLISSFEKQTRSVENQKVVTKNKNTSINTNNVKQEQQIYEGQEEEQNLISESMKQENNLTSSQYQIRDENTTLLSLSTTSTSIQHQQELYTPPQIPLDSYVSPPTEKYFPTSSSVYSLSSVYSPSTPSNFPRYQETQKQQQSYKSFPVSQPTYSSYQTLPPKSPYYPSTGGNSSTKQLSTSWSPQNETQSIKTSTNFNPSPLPYEKLAKFENPDSDDSYFQVPHHQPTYRPKTKVIHNVSPVSFATKIPPTAGGSINVGYSSVPSVTNSFQPVNKQQLYHCDNHPSNDVFAYSSGVESQPTSSRVSSVDLSQYQNYNTAPRGWTQMHDYYRPVTFASKQSVGLPYSDF